MVLFFCFFSGFLFFEVFFDLFFLGGNFMCLVFSSICWDVEVIKQDTGMDTGKETNLSILEFLDQS